MLADTAACSQLGGAFARRILRCGQSGTDLVYRFPVELAALPHPLGAVFAAIRHAAVVGIDAEPQAASAHDDLVFIERTASEHPVDPRWDVLAAVRVAPDDRISAVCDAAHPDPAAA